MHFIVIDTSACAVNAVSRNVEVLAAYVYGAAVRKMSAVGQVHTQYRVTGIKQRKVHGKVCACAAVRLNVGMLTAVNLFQPVDCQLFHNVHVLATAVVPFAGITFGVLVCKHTSHRFQYGR